MIGVYYYPEQWPVAQWERDINNIRALGMKHIHMAEFAWTHLEPEEDNFQFKWLDKAITLAENAGLDIILCTPTATPPVWLSENYPDSLMIRENGRRVTHGSRAHRCVNSHRFNQYAERITTKIAERYGNHSSVIGWQIDNEIGHYDKAPCYCDDCRRQFITYLKDRYQSIYELNVSWGGDFWSQNYQEFDQIQLPNTQTLPYSPNEHALLDFRRFFSISLSRFLERQSALLKKYIQPKAWITHNFMTDDPMHFPGHVQEGLDLYTLTIYPVAGLYQGEPGRELQRIGDPYGISFKHDYTRSFNGKWGIMEQQPGQVNWGPYNLRPYPRTTRLWLWTAVAHGADLLDTYRYRQPRCGSEQYHEGIVGLDGTSLSAGGEDFVQVASELDEIQSMFEEDSPITQRKAALFVDWDSLTAIEIHPQSRAFDGQACVERFYRSLKRLGFHIDILFQDKDYDLSQYDVVCAALVDLVDQKLINDWKNYTKSGGQLILSPRTATRDRFGHFPEEPYANLLSGLCGEKLVGYDVMPEGHQGTIQLNHSKTQIHWNTWAEQFEIGEGAIPLATFTDQFYKGSIASFKKNIGKGSVTVIGFDQTEGICSLVEKSLLESFSDLIVLDDHTLFEIRGSAGIFMNYNDKPVNLPKSILQLGMLVIGSDPVPEAGVAIIKIID